MVVNKKEVDISPEIDQIINGYVMGDGYLNTRGSLQVDQGKNQRKFVEWMFEKLKHLCTPNCVISPTYKKGSDRTDAGEIKSYRFTTRAVLKDYRKRWYLENQFEPTSNGKKCLPVNIDQIFTPVFVALWYACDGTKIIGSKGAKFEVTAFSPKERETLKNLFKDKFQIETKIIPQGSSKTGTPQWALSINAGEYDKFHDLIANHELIAKLFTYKLHY